MAFCGNLNHVHHVLPVNYLPLMICSEVSCHACFNFSCLRCGSPTLQPFPHELDLHTIFECAHLKFTVYEAVSKQTSIYTHTLAQCSSASVGLVQAHPSKPTCACTQSLLYILLCRDVNTIYLTLVHMHSCTDSYTETMAKRKGKTQTEENVQLGPQVAEGENVFGVAHIFASFNDTFVHVTDLSGR